MPRYPFEIAQYFWLRQHAGFVELEKWSSITLTGKDRQAFLHNFCTNDVKRLIPGTSCEAFFTNVKGKIIGHGLITGRDGELVIVGPPGQGDLLSAHLNRYVIREDVEVRDTTDDRSYVLLAGGGLARDIAVAMAPTVEIGQSWLQPLLNAVGTVVDVPVLWIRWDLLGQCFCGLLEIRSNDVPRVQRILQDRGAVPCEQAAFHAARIEAGVPLFGIDFNDQNLPQEVGRNEQAISFTKGCYLGQETVARIDALGHVNQQLAGVRFLSATVPEPGTLLIHDGRAVSHVTSATYSPQLQAPLALAMLRREHAPVNTRLDSSAGECEVVVLPV
jgi:folate-binding protein YgfZ